MCKIQWLFSILGRKLRSKCSVYVRTVTNARTIPDSRTVLQVLPADCSRNYISALHLRYDIVSKIQQIHRVSERSTFDWWRHCMLSKTPPSGERLTWGSIWRRLGFNGYTVRIAPRARTEGEWLASRDRDSGNPAGLPNGQLSTDGVTIRRKQKESQYHNVLTL